MRSSSVRSWPANIRAVSRSCTFPVAIAGWPIREVSKLGRDLIVIYARLDSGSTKTTVPR